MVLDTLKIQNLLKIEFESIRDQLYLLTIINFTVTWTSTTNIHKAMLFLWKQVRLTISSI